MHLQIMLQKDNLLLGLQRKKLRLMYREYSGSYESALHRNHWWNGTTATGTDLFS